MGGTKKFPRHEAEDAAYKVLSYLSGIKKSKICGSIRRKRPEVGDIDIVVVLDNEELFYKSIENFFDKKFNAIIGSRVIRIDFGGIQVDIMVVSDDQYGAAVLHLTGSKYFNIRCRTRANQQGYLLNQYGLWSPDGDLIDNTEEGILEKLGMEKYQDPKDRK